MTSEQGQAKTDKSLNFQPRVNSVSPAVQFPKLCLPLPYRLSFVPVGWVASPEFGVVYIDTGNSRKPGIIDHHCQGNRADSACELLLRHPELLLDHLRKVPAAQIEFRLHHQPDLDSTATLYVALELLQAGPRLPLLEKLARYVSQIDQGIVPDPEQLAASLYGVFLARQSLLELKSGESLTDLMLLEDQLRLLDTALFLMTKDHPAAQFSSIFRFQPDWFPEERGLLSADQEQYKEDLKFRSLTYPAFVNGRPEAVAGLWLDHPHSLLFKQWARDDPEAPEGKGYQFLAVDRSRPGKNRFVISVAPQSGTDLKGLGELLERAEEKKRQALGRERPLEPRRYPGNNSDPWYGGWGHNYTIIDSPREGTVLTAEEVRKIHQNWRP